MGKNLYDVYFISTAIYNFNYLSRKLLKPLLGVPRQLWGKMVVDERGLRKSMESPVSHPTRPDGAMLWVLRTTVTKDRSFTPIW